MMPSPVNFPDIVSGLEIQNMALVSHQQQLDSRLDLRLTHPMPYQTQFTNRT